MRRVALLFWAALPLTFAPAPLPRRDAERATLAGLQGEWQRARDPSGVGVAFAGNRMRYVVRGRVTAEYSVLWRPSANPPRFDRRDVETPDRILRGVYRLEGDTLTVNWAAWGMPRP